LLIAAAAGQLLTGVPAVGAGPIVVPWPRCEPLCARRLAHGPRITAIYLSIEQTRGRPVVTIDVFAAGLRGQSVTGQLCYEAHHVAD
jgi:hypothetical protein